MKDIQISIGLIMLVAGLLGMYIHFRVAKHDGRELGKFFDYLMADNPGKTGLTLFAYVGAMSTLFALGSFDQLRLDAFIAALRNGYLYAPMAQGVAQAITAGYMADSMLNKGV